MAKKKKRQLKKGFKIALVVCIVIISAALIYYPTYRTNNKLKELGYDSVTIKNIKSEDLTNVILDNNYYSTYLAQSINTHTLNKDYIELYTYVSEDRTLEDIDFLLYNRLFDLGYESDQLENLYKHLTFDEMLPLLIFDYQWDENPYIEDVIENREENTDGVVNLSGDYYTPYKVPTTTETPDDISTLVNKKNGLPDSYEPNDLITLSLQYSATTMSLRSEAAEAFENMAYAGEMAGHNFYATGAYNSKEDQEYAYQYYTNSVGSMYVEYYTAKPRYSEHETGLAVNVIPTYESEEFIETETYQWLKEHCAEYGFIERYPPNTSLYTNVYNEQSHYRYVGKELAKAVQDSNLTYDVFYALYLADWVDETNQPSQDILDRTNPLQ